MIYFTTKPVNPRMFVKRNEFSKLEKIIFSGHQVAIISGYAGLGKTSMLKFFMYKHAKNFNFLKYEIEPGTTHSKLKDIVFRALKGEYRDSEKINFQKAKGGLDIQFLRIGGEKGKAKIQSIIELPDLDSIISLLSETSKDTKKPSILILDNLEEASPDFKRKLLSLITKFHEADKLNLILSGWPEALDSLLSQVDNPKNKGILRRFSSIGMKPMPDKDAQKVIERGFKYLKYSYSKDIPKRIASYSKEDLGLIHEVGSEIHNLLKKKKDVTLEIVKKAEILVGKSNEFVYSRKFDKIITQRGGFDKIGIREGILLILCLTNSPHRKNEIEKQLAILSANNINIGKSINQAELDLLVNNNHIKKFAYNAYLIIDSRYSAYLKMRCMSDPNYLLIYKALGEPLN